MDGHLCSDSKAKTRGVGGDCTVLVYVDIDIFIYAQKWEDGELPLLKYEAAFSHITRMIAVNIMALIGL